MSTLFQTVFTESGNELAYVSRDLFSSMLICARESWQGFGLWPRRCSIRWLKQVARKEQCGQLYGNHAMEQCTPLD
ncbi:hypothetical protein DL89DRAFT_266150 [Linderina pennispora]|uniref:Uncharacterized protein n=1 Tax=Linderina pennispora TaxID=61395 RepID=A0A1Y1WC62_9FUNG|nr:uncharacterized protein DL89DRAFT_266150 [Linderina pennispora]ORX71131.1 hypothetical protein DL89DRAFT_266150 [Linderina pennispora]